MIKRNRFGRRGCFKCIGCGKLTRETDINEGLDMCPCCTEISWIWMDFENNNDAGYKNEEEVLAKVQDIKVKYSKQEGIEDVKA